MFGISVSLAQGKQGIVSNDQFDVYFAKTELDQKSGELSFNVVNITNKTGNPIPIKPRLNVPNGFAVFSKDLIDTIVPPNSTIRLPYRLRITTEAAGNVEYDIVFRLFSSENKLILENKTIVKPESFHNWEVDLPNDRVFFYPRFNMAEFQVVLKNNGNVGELIILEIKPDQKLSFSNEMEDDWKANQTIYIEPKTDTVISFKVNYTYSKNRVFDVSKVHITASTKEKEVNKTAFVEKYVDEYATTIVDNTMPHRTEVGVRSSTLSNANEVEPFLNAKGFIDFKKSDNSFSYFFSNYRLNETDNFVRNSNYRFLFQGKKLSAGLGNFGSQLGRNLYSRNALMVDYKSEIGPDHKIEGYASQDILDPKTSGAIGHWWDNGKYNIHTAISYNVNQVNKINTGTLVIRTKELPIYKEHRLNGVLYGLREDYSWGNKFYQQGFAWDLTYLGNIGTKFRFRVINNYGSRNIPGNQRGLFNISTLLTFFPKDLMTYISSNFHFTKRDFYYRDYNGDKLPTIYLQDLYGNLIYNNYRNPNFIWSIGPSFESYDGRRPELANFDYSTYKVQRVSLEIRSYFMKNLRLDLDFGLRDVYFEGNQIIDKSKFEFHLTGFYSRNGYGARIRYDYGPMVYKGLYQRPIDMEYNGISIGPYISRTYANKRVNVLLYTNYIYRFDMKYSYINVSPNVEVYLARNWYTKVIGNYNYFRQNSTEYKSRNSNYYVGLSVIKKWGNSEYTKKNRQLRRLKIVCFKDENGNGRKDKFEHGIPHVKTRLKLIREEIQPSNEQFPLDIALLTNEEGFVIYKQIPKGFYEVDVIPLTDMREYFYVSKTHEQIDLIENMTYYIPFQKASKVDGNLNVKRAKFLNNQKIDLSRIKITAYNNAGNSYSSFTRADGSFTIYVPGDTTYFVRMENVFGSKFDILQNDIPIKVPNTTEEVIIFNIVEKTRQVNFKKAKQPTQGGPQKTKILKGKIYENTDRKPIEEDALPEFEMGDGTAYEKNISSGKYYVVLSQNLSRDDALIAVGIYDETNIKAFFGFDENTATHYVFTDEYNTRDEAQKAMKELKKKGVKNASIMVFK